MRLCVVEFKQKVVRSWAVPLRSIYKSVQTDFLFFVFITGEEVEKEENREYSGWSK